MNWSDRTMSNTLTVEKYTVNDIIANYVQNLFYVNRRYQRKLVWGIDEKRLLIDSMIREIPLPAILLVKYDVPSENKRNILEIVDGMQRLNAIISFVLGEFSIEYNNENCYFDPNANNETFQLLMNQDKQLKKHDRLLPKELCIEFCRYQIPAIITGKDNATVDMIFSRINSTGRQISSHDLRQSKAVGEFPDLVRRVASDVRLDHTYDDHICLCDIPKISVGYKQYGYGVDLDAVFWRRHDLIDPQNIKESKDEEIIETLFAMILLKDFKKSKDRLDQLYEKGTILNNQIENRISELGKDNLENKFRKTFDTIDMVFDSVNSDFSSFLFSSRRVSNKDECFKVLFIAVYRLLEEGFVISNYQEVANAIKDAAGSFDAFTKSSRIDYAQVSKTIDIVYKLLRPAFVKQIAKKHSELQDEIDKRLGYSKIERQMTEFKVGISDFSSTSVNMNVIHDIAKTLVAMANTTSAKEEGLVVLGVADSKEAYDSWYSTYKEQALINNQHYIPGITKEAEKLCGSTDSYYRRIRKLLDTEPISEKLKEYILETFEPFDYHDTELLVFKSKNIGETCFYNGVKYVRHSNETVRV